MYSKHACDLLVYVGCKLIHKSLLQSEMEEQLAELSAELQIKKLLTSDQKILHAKFTDIKLKNVRKCYCTQ